MFCMWWYYFNSSQTSLLVTSSVDICICFWKYIFVKLNQNDYKYWDCNAVHTWVQFEMRLSQSRRVAGRQVRSSWCPRISHRRARSTHDMSRSILIRAIPIHPDREPHSWIIPSSSQPSFSIQMSRIWEQRFLPIFYSVCFQRSLLTKSIKQTASTRNHIICGSFKLC